MKRSPMRRTRMARGKVRVGAAAKRRIRAGGPLSKGRQSLGLVAWRALVDELRSRARERCEVPTCRKSVGLRGDPHHVVKRSAGGADDLHNLVYICRDHHRATDLSADNRDCLSVTKLWADAVKQIGFRFWWSNMPHRDLDLILWSE